MRFDDYRESDNVGDQRGQSFGGGGGFGAGGFGGVPGLALMIGSRFGIGGIIVVVIGLMLLGMNPLSMLGGGSASQVGSGGQQTQVSKQGAYRACSVDAASTFTCRILASAEDTWAPLLSREGVGFMPAELIFYSGSGMSGCGAAQSAMGPFYCPTDNRIYLDTAFFDELANRFQAQGDFAQAYVIAHEFGHHIQFLTGTAQKVAEQQQRLEPSQANALQVRMELQADCYAGVWGHRNKDRLEAGDVEEGMRAAQAIGDDTLQRQAQGRVVPDSFTHGTSAQRQAWLKKGLESGEPSSCDTFAPGAA